MNSQEQPQSQQRVIASFDIGIKNMAYCVLIRGGTADATETVTEILDWGIISMIEPPPDPPKCCALTNTTKKNASKTVCNNNAYFCRSNKEEFYCKKHTDKNKIINSKELAAMKKLSMEKLRGFAQERGIALSAEKQTRAELIEKITGEINTHFFVPVSAVAATDAKELDLITAGRIMTRELDRVFVKTGLIQRLTHVYIENQISTIAARMKTIQGMLTQYFIMSCAVTAEIKYISAALKLRGKIGKKSTYSERKKMSIEICEKTLIESQYNAVKKWADFFKNYGAKRDDLADCFLQGLAAE